MPLRVPRRGARQRHVAGRPTCAGRSPTASVALVGDLPAAAGGRGQLAARPALLLASLPLSGRRRRADRAAGRRGVGASRSLPGLFAVLALAVRSLASCSARRHPTPTAWQAARDAHGGGAGLGSTRAGRSAARRWLPAAVLRLPARDLEILHPLAVTILGGLVEPARSCSAARAARAVPAAWPRHRAGGWRQARRAARTRSLRRPGDRRQRSGGPRHDANDRQGSTDAREALVVRRRAGAAAAILAGCGRPRPAADDDAAGDARAGRRHRRSRRSP